MSENQRQLSADYVRVAEKTTFGTTSVPSRNVNLSAPLVTDDPQIVARNRINVINRRIERLRGINNG